MNIGKRYICIFLIELFVVILLSTNAFTKTTYYILNNDSNQKMYCDLLEIKNNQVLCTANNILITYDTTHVKQLQFVRNGTSYNFQNFSQETINKINRLNSHEYYSKKIREQQGNKKKILDFVSKSAHSLINSFKIKSRNNSLNTILLISGLIVFVFGSVGFTIATFRVGVLWGLSCIFLPFISFVFLFVHWKTAAKPFLVSVVGVSILFLSTMLLPTTEIRTSGILKLPSATNHARINKKNSSFQCSGKIYCSQMSSCSEAQFYLNNCPGTKMDGDNDGVPCEKQWCGR